MTVWSDRQIHLGTGANIKLGGSVKFKPSADPNIAAATEFEAALTKVLGIVNRFAEQIENNVDLPDQWPGAPKKEGA